MNPVRRHACYRVPLPWGFLKLSNYRLYRLDGAGKITAAEWIEAAEDADALREAQGRVDGGSFELWQKDRLVERHRA